MIMPPIYRRTASRADRWEAESARNSDIKRRVRSGQTITQVARYYSLSENFVGRIAGAMGQ